jgi:hypothetical protein
LIGKKLFGGSRCGMHEQGGQGLDEIEPVAMKHHQNWGARVSRRYSEKYRGCARGLRRLRDVKKIVAVGAHAREIWNFIQVHSKRAPASEMRIGKVVWPRFRRRFELKGGYVHCSGAEDGWLPVVAAAEQRERR